MHSYGSDEAPEKFVLVESLPESEGIQQLITTESLPTRNHLPCFTIQSRNSCLSRRFDWFTNMTPISVFWNSNMADAKSYA